MPEPITEIDTIHSIPALTVLDETKDDAQINLAKEVNKASQEALDELDVSVKPVPNAQPLSGAEETKKIGNVAYEILGYGQKALSVLDTSMHQISDTIEEITKQSRQVVDLQKKFAKFSGEKKSILITDDLRQALDNLKTLGIDLPVENEKELSTDVLANIKTALDGMKTQLQTDTQKDFMKIQQKTQQYNSILDSLKIIIRHFTNLISTISQHMARQ